MLSELLVGKDEESVLEEIKDNDFFKVLDMLEDSKLDGTTLPYSYSVEGFDLFTDSSALREIIKLNFDFKLIKRSKNGSCYSARSLNYNTSTRINGLPENMEVNGSLSISYNPLKTLPKGLHVKGDLEVDSCQLSKLPPDLYVGGNLFITDNDIREIPETIHIGGKIYTTGNNNMDLSKVPQKFEVWDMHRKR